VEWAQLSSGWKNEPLMQFGFQNQTTFYGSQTGLDFNKLFQNKFGSASSFGTGFQYLA